MLSGGDGGDIGSLMVEENNSTRSSARGFPTRWFSSVSDPGHAFKLGNSGVIFSRTKLSQYQEFKGPRARTFGL